MVKLMIKMLHRPGVGFVDRGPADCNIGANKQPLQWWVVGSGGSSVWPPADDRKTIKIEDRMKRK